MIPILTSISRVTILCNGCDFLKKDTNCSKLARDIQWKYATAGNCGLANVGGQVGTMTLKGFISDNSIPPEIA